MSIQAVSQIQEHDNLQLYVSIALGGNSYLHPFIDKFYKEREWEFYEAFERSGLKGNPLFSMYTTKSEERIRQVAGMIEWSNKYEDFSLIDQLMKKGYKFAYQYFQQNQIIDFDDFMRSYAKRQKKKIVKELDLIYQNIVLWYMCKQEGKAIHTKDIAWQSFQEVLSTSLKEVEIKEMMFSKTMLKKYEREIGKLYSEYNIPRNNRFDTIGTLLDYLIAVQLQKIVASNPNITAEKAEQKVFEVSPTKYIGALGGWLKTLQIHELDAMNQLPFSKTELDMVFLEVIYAKKYHYISENDQDLFFITCLYQKCLSSLYHESKQLYLDQSKQDFYIKIKAKEAQLLEQEIALKRKQQEWQSIHHRQQEEVKGLTDELREANARIRQLEQQIQTMDDCTKEVYALRDFVYREEHPVQKAPSIEMMAKFINARNIVIIGGSLNWQQKISELLPNVEFFEVDEINKDISKMKRADAVFINTSVFSHAFYNKVMKHLNKRETPMFYLRGQSNREKTIGEIFDWLTE